MFERATGGAAGMEGFLDGVGAVAGFAAKKLDIDCCFWLLFGWEDDLAVALGISWCGVVRDERCQLRRTRRRNRETRSAESGKMIAGKDLRDYHSLSTAYLHTVNDYYSAMGSGNTLNLLEILHYYLLSTSQHSG